MTTPKADVTVLDLDSPEGKALAERLRRGMEEAKAQVRNHGGTSYEDFYIDENGKPRSLAEDD